MLPEEIFVVGLAVGVSLLAIVVSLVAADFVRRASGLVVLVAGVLLVAVTLFHLAPEAAKLGSVGIWALGVGAVIGGGLELAGRWLAKDRSSSGGQTVARMALLALAVHSTIDGGVYAVTFSHGEVSGLLVGLGLVLHEAPEGAIALVLALQTGWSRWQAIGAAILASSLTTPLGWVGGSLAGAAAHGEIETLFAGSAGLLAYSGVRLIASALRREQEREAARKAD
jgi:zinc and cadmium transporter